MATSYSFLDRLGAGITAEEFINTSFRIYVTISGTKYEFAYCEDSMTVISEQDEKMYKRNVDGTRVTVVKSTLESRFGIEFQSKQFNPDIMAMLYSGTIEGVSDGVYVHQGSKVVEQTSYIWDAEGYTKNGKAIKLHIYKGDVSITGNPAIGGDDFPNVPVRIDALVDDTQSSNQKDLARWFFGDNLTGEFTATSTMTLV